MRRLEIEDAEVMRIAIQQEIERSEESRYDHRLHGVLLVASGQSCNSVAELFAEDARTIQRWIHRFEKGGFDALREGERPGRPGALQPAQWRRLEIDLRRSPREFGYGHNLWDGRVLSEHLRSRYAVELGVRQCQRLFGRLDFRLRKPRPQVAQADPQRVAAVERTARSGPAP